MSNLRCVVSAVGGAPASLRLPRRPAAKLGKRSRAGTPLSLVAMSLQVFTLGVELAELSKSIYMNHHQRYPTMETPEQLLQLRVLQRQYFQLVEPHRLRWPDEATLKRPEVQTWLFVNLFDSSKISSPPPARYQLRVLKELVGKLERSITDPEEDVWSPISSSRFLPLLCVQPCTIPEDMSSIAINLLRHSLTLPSRLVTGNLR
jgi:hypothetical protein